MKIRVGIRVSNKARDEYREVQTEGRVRGIKVGGRAHTIA